MDHDLPTTTTKSKGIPHRLPPKVGVVDTSGLIYLLQNMASGALWRATSLCADFDKNFVVFCNTDTTSSVQWIVL